MSQENVEIVRRFVLSDLDDMSDAHPDIVWSPVDEKASHGHEGVQASLARWQGEWDEYEEALEELVDVGDRVFVTSYFRGRGRGSGIEVDARYYQVYMLCDGKIMRMDEYATRAEALEAAGLRE